MESHGSGGDDERRGEEKMKAVLIDANPPPPPPIPCPRCNSGDTKFCYYNNYSQSQPRHFCKTCRRYWTEGGALRNIPVGGSIRRYKRPRYDAIPNVVPHQLIVPSASGFGGCGFFSSMVKFQEMNQDPFEAVFWGNFLRGEADFKMPSIKIAPAEEEVRRPRVRGYMNERDEDDDEDEVKPDFKLPRIGDDGAGGSGGH